MTVGGCILARLPIGNSQPPIPRPPPKHWSQPLSMRTQVFPAAASQCTWRLMRVAVCVYGRGGSPFVPDLPVEPVWPHWLPQVAPHW